MIKSIAVTKTTDVVVDKKLIKWSLSWLVANKLGHYISIGLNVVFKVVKRVFTTEVISYEECKRRGLVVLSSNIPK